MRCQKSEVDVVRDPAVDAMLLKEQQDKSNRGPKYMDMQVCFVWGWWWGMWDEGSEACRV